MFLLMMNHLRDALKMWEIAISRLIAIGASGGGYNAVLAEIELIRTALGIAPYDRLTFLQGADYPLKTDKEICDYYANNKKVEFCRACKCTDVDDGYFHEKCRYILYYNKPNLLKKIWNKFERVFKIKFRDGYIHDGNEKYPVYWGSAQWSFTNECAEYVLKFHENHPVFNKWFLHAFPADELYFSTVVMNSPYRDKTLMGGPENVKKGLSNWRNLHYFEYLPGMVRVFSIDDKDELMGRRELYFRKVNTVLSGPLLDFLDDVNNSRIK